MRFVLFLVCQSNSYLDYNLRVFRLGHLHSFERRQLEVVPGLLPLTVQRAIRAVQSVRGNQLALLTAYNLFISHHHPSSSVQQVHLQQLSTTCTPCDPPSLPPSNPPPLHTMADPASAFVMTKTALHHGPTKDKLPKSLQAAEQEDTECK